MEGGVVDVFINALPRLQAEEVLIAIQVAQMGGGLLEKRDQQRILQRWRRVAEVAPRATPVSPAVLASMGITFEVKKTDG